MAQTFHFFKAKFNSSNPCSPPDYPPPKNYKKFIFFNVIKDAEVQNYKIRTIIQHVPYWNFIERTIKFIKSEISILLVNKNNIYYSLAGKNKKQGS